MTSEKGTLRCRLLGHRCRYVEGIVAEIRAECVRSGCDYEQELTDNWSEQQ